MKNSKLTELLQSLTKSEQQKFLLFLKSPFHTKSKQVLLLYKAIKQSGNWDVSINKRKLFDKIYSKGLYNDRKLRSVISDLTGLVKKFIITECLHNTIIPETILLNELKSRKTLKNFYGLYKKLTKAYMNFNVNTEKEYLLKYYQAYNLLSIADIKLSKDKPELLDKFIQITSFYTVYLLLRNINNKIQEDLPALEFKLDNDLLIWIEKIVNSNFDLIRKKHLLLFGEYLILKMFTSDNDIVFYSKLTEYYRKTHKLLNAESKTYIYNSLENFYINLSGIKPRIDFLAQRFNTIEIFESSGYFRDIEFIAGSSFFNIINSCIDNSEYDYANWFFNKYKEKIDDPFKNDVINLCAARIKLRLKEHDIALRHLSLITNKHPHFYLNSKTLQSVIYYELKDFERLLYIIDAAKHYLKRKKIKIGLRYKIYYKFFSYLQLIINKTETNQQKALIALSEKINKENMVMKNWLIKLTK